MGGTSLDNRDIENQRISFYTTVRYDHKDTRQIDTNTLMLLKITMLEAHWEIDLGWYLFL